MDESPYWSVYSGWVPSVSFLLLVNNSEVAAVPVAMTDMAVNVPVHAIPTKVVPWATNREQASRCSGDIDGNNVLSLVLDWFVVEAYMC